MSEGIELHDSELFAISVDDGTAAVHFSPAIIYRPSEIYGPAGSSVWLQPAILTFHNAFATAWTADPPVWVSEGAFRIGNTIHDNLIPLSGTFAGSVELSMTLVTAEKLAIRGQGITIQLLGEPTYLEEFLPEQGENAG